MSRQNPVRRLSEELEGLINLYLTLLLLFLLCVAAVSFHHGIAITFPNRHLPVINNRVSICLALPSTSRIDLARVTPRRPNSKTSQSLLHTPRCVSSLRRASQPDLSWFFPSIHHPDSASASSGFLTITPTSLSHSLPAPAFSSLFSLSTSSNSYSQTTTQHHLLLHSLALTSAHSLASVLAPDSSFSLLLQLPSPPSAALPLLSLLFASNSEHCSSASCKVSLSQFRPLLFRLHDAYATAIDLSYTYIMGQLANMVSFSTSSPSKSQRPSFFPFHQPASKVSHLVRLPAPLSTQAACASSYASPGHVNCGNLSVTIFKSHDADCSST